MVRESRGEEGPREWSLQAQKTELREEQREAQDGNPETTKRSPGKGEKKEGSVLALDISDRPGPMPHFAQDRLGVCLLSQCHYS